jgi:hypothetical protein
MSLFVTKGGPVVSCDDEVIVVTLDDCDLAVVSFEIDQILILEGRRVKISPSFNIF